MFLKEALNIWWLLESFVPIKLSSVDGFGAAIKAAY